MLISRLLGETGSDPVVCPRNYGLLKKKAWQKMIKLRENRPPRGIQMLNGGDFSHEPETQEHLQQLLHEK